jgi:hypothetical protein
MPVYRRSSTSNRVRFPLIAALVAFTVVVVSYRPGDSFVSYAQADGQVTHQIVNSNFESWMIREPNVRQHMTPYPQIRFHTGDRIIIEAGGCVQTGGLGRTWKRYVDPEGPNTTGSNGLYFGLIWIPGVIGLPAATGVPPDLKRIAPYLGQNQSVIVPPGLDPNQLFLRLGYQDDDYSDNGYYSHDDGTQDQCKGIGNAYVSITRVGGQGPAPASPAPLPFDLVWNSEDDNGIPLNPKWGWQITHPGALPDPKQCVSGPFSGECTNWSNVVTRDTADICAAEQFEPGKSNEPPLFGIAGHVNWAASTYQGRIIWESHSAPGTDDDYNFKFFPPGGAGLVSVRDNIEVEFDSDETVDHFTGTWWNLLHTTVDNNNDAAVNSSLFTEPDGTAGRYAIVTGLIGLEMCHSGSNELHPAWAMAIRVKDDDPSDEVWAMFVRLGGDEGFCSGNEHYLTDLPGGTYSFRLPWRPGASSVSLGAKTTFLQTSGGASGPGFQFAPNQGVIVSFTNLTVPQSGEGNIIYGELHLQWPGGQGPAPIPAVAAPRRLLPAPAVAMPGSGARLAGTGIAGTGSAGRLPVGGALIQEEPEARLASAVAKLSPAQRSQFLALLGPRPAAANHPQPLRPGAFTRIQSLPQHPARLKHPLQTPQYKSVPDPEKRARNQRIFDWLQKNLGIKPARRR